MRLFCCCSLFLLVATLAACGDLDSPGLDADAPRPEAGADAAPGPQTDAGTDGGDAGKTDGGTPATGVLQNANGANARYAGIGRSQAGATCTASLLDVGGEDEAPAYVLTAGHCTGWWDHTDLFEERPPNSPGEVIFHFFTDTAEARRAVPVAVASYSSMVGTDVAILRLDATVGALRDIGVEGLPLAPSMPAEGSAIANVGAPTTTFEDPEEHLRRGSCSLGPRTRLVEFEWLWPDTVAHDCPDIRVGSSGSPLLDESEAIFAIVHTTTSGPPHARCHLGRPCELHEDGIRSPDATSYAIPVAGLGACFVSGVLDLESASCSLQRPSGLIAAREGARYVAAEPEATARVALSSEAGITHAQAKWGLATSTDCSSQDGWSTAFAIAETPVLEVPLPLTDQLVVACLRGGPSSEDIEAPESAIAWLVQVDGTPPELPLPVSYVTAGDTATFTVVVENPTYARYLHKFGLEASIDCGDLDGYTNVNVRFGRFMVPLTSEPMRVCVLALDFAANRSEPMEWVLTGD